MRVCGVVLFAVTALFAGSDADLSVKGKKTVASAILATGTVDLLPFAGNGAPANRFLREDEERVGGSVSIVDKFKGLKSTLQLRANKGNLQAKCSRAWVWLRRVTNCSTRRSLQIGSSTSTLSTRIIPQRRRLLSRR
ncbi:hypothetical protein PF008_g13894 [Phytophthora fragariae]|uniref:RxLR effector protein n=1 Tax=Phytophthora fragariae TaxID=53985 RepID=A0A6G0RIJ2_9STRA|nr:hypothetical protein PF008_g13894 [Phytophthora fragariae]